MSDLADAIQRGWATANPDAPEPTVSYFYDLLGQHPEDQHALFACASALDFASREAEAAPAYERASIGANSSTTSGRCGTTPPP